MQSASSGTAEIIIARQVGIAGVGTNARVKNMAVLVDVEPGTKHNFLYVVQ